MPQPKEPCEKRDTEIAFSTASPLSLAPVDSPAPAPPVTCTTAPSGASSAYARLPSVVGATT